MTTRHQQPDGNKAFSAPSRRVWIPFVALGMAIVLFLVIVGSQLPGGAESLSVDGANRFSPPRTISLPALSLTQGSPLSTSDLQGHWSVVSFGYLSCPDVCPVTTSVIHRVLENRKAGGRSEQLSFFYVTMDPARDNAEMMNAYLQHFSPVYQGVTGSPENISDFARQLGVSFYPSAKGPDGFYTMIHNSAISLLDPDGKLAGRLEGVPSAEQLDQFLNEMLNSAG